MQSMTYGVMPTSEQFQEAFDRECPSGTFSIRMNGRDAGVTANFLIGDGDWTALQLWEAINEISHYQPGADEAAKYRHDAAMNLVSSILDILGFEWV